MISFFAYHGDAALRRGVIDRIAGFITDGRLADGIDGDGERMSLVQAFADGAYDLSAAHRNSGFTVALLTISDGIYQGLPLDEASQFALTLAKAASIDANISDVPWDFLKWMFEEAVSDLGPSRIRATAREAGHMFKLLAEVNAPTPTLVHKAKALAKRARRQGRTLPGPEETLVAIALGAALDRAGEHAGYAVHWIARLSEQPVEQYRRYARKLLELVETA
jgi:hypothetical protein